MDKIYKFEVVGMPTENDCDSFVNKLLAETKLENEQSDLAIRINKETRQVHIEVLRDIIDKLNSVMTQLDLKPRFAGVGGHGTEEYGYMKPHTELFDGELDGLVIGIAIDGKHRDSGFTSTGRFPAFTGHYEVNVRLFPPFGNCDWKVLERENCVNNILELMKPYLKNKLKAHK
jgi:hypothetical protein